MPSPLVSVIMPAYNAGAYIADSIESVLRQTYRHWELIVIDDGSTDNTSTVVKEYQQKDSRIYYFYQTNSRQAKARNLGISHSKGELLAFLDSDDLWLPEKLEFSIGEFGKGNQDMLFTNTYILRGNEDIDKFEDFPVMCVPTKLYHGADGLAAFLDKNKVPMLTALVRKDVVEKAGRFRIESDGKAEDYELWLNLLAEGCTLRGVDKPLSVYRIHNASTTSTNNIDMNVVLMLLRFFSEHPKLIPEYRLEILNWYKRSVNGVRDKEEMLNLLNSKILNTFSFNTGYSKILQYMKQFVPEKYLRAILRRHILQLDRKVNERK